MTMLTYTLVTDPAPLEASAAGRTPSTGTVYLVVTNTGQSTAYWSTIDVAVPVGDGAGHLTPDLTKVRARGERDGAQPVTVQVQGPATIRATSGSGTRTLAPGDYMVLTLEDVTVAASAGVAVLKVTEAASRTATGKARSTATAVALVKTAAKAIPAPRDLRPDTAVVSAGGTVVLRWEGSGDFDYQVRYPGGQETVPTGARAWSPATAPRQATTYTLVATSRTTPPEEHYLTTTVQVSDPVLDGLTVPAGISAPWVQGTAGTGRVTFTGAGAEITDGSGGRGTLYAAKADLTGVNTEWVQGRSTDDGWISFPKTGLQVSMGGTDTARGGAVYTEFVYAKDVPWEQGGGWINLHSEGITVYVDKAGGPDFGSVTGRIDRR
ncbi:hypothetical protein [Nonomuraea longicatena]|uniref:Uncharacterized protein n=1 Tax=Nonomuraea longicatena TaxID=83682 RepID=A0ABP4AX89_9ACTN